MFCMYESSKELSRILEKFFPLNFIEWLSDISMQNGEDELAHQWLESDFGLVIFGESNGLLGMRSN